MKRGFLTPSNAINGNAGESDTPDKIGPDKIGVGQGSLSELPETQPAPPWPPKKPIVSNLTSDSATVQWQIGAVESPLGEACGKGFDSPSRPGKEPAGGQDEMNEEGEDTENGKEVGVPSQLFRSSVLLVEKTEKSATDGEEEKTPGGVRVDGTWCSELFEGTGGFEAKLTNLEAGRHYSILASIHSEDHGDVDGDAECFSAAPSQPARPEQPVVSGKGKNFVKLRWPEPSGRGSPVAQYEVEIRNSSHFTQLSATEIGMWGCGVQVHQGPETRCEIKGLRPGTSLQARVRAFNSIGASQPSPWVTLTTSATVPAAPPRPFVGQANIGNLFFGWYESEDNGGAAIESYCFEIDQGTDDGFMVKYNGPDRHWLLTNTVCGHPYKCRVKARNSVGSSPFSEVLEVQGMCGPPTPPGSPEAMEVPPGVPSAGSSFSICLRWAPPLSDNGSRIQMYQVVMRRIVHDMPVDFYQVVYAGSDTWCQIQGLFPASFYEFGVVAVSLLGTSAPSMTSIFSTAGAPPGPPPPPFLMGIEGGSVHVGWTLPDVCNGSPVSSFVLESLVQDDSVVDVDHASASGHPAGWVSCVQYQGGGISKWIQGLNPGIAVWLRVAAINSHGQGPFSTPANIMTPCVVPGKVAQVSAIATGPGRGCVSWESPSKNGGMPITSYRVWVGKKGVGGSDPIQLTVEGAGPALVEGLVAGTLYQAKVQAVNRVGVGEFSDAFIFSSEASSPSAPKMPVVWKVETDSIGLSWEKPAQDNGAAVEEYLLEMSQTSATASADASAGAAKSAWRVIYKGCFMSFQVGSLEPGGIYRFRVRGRNAAGDGPFSPPVQAVTEAVPPGPPLAVGVVSVSAKELKLKWSAPAFNGGSDITSYAVMLQNEAAGAEREVYRGVPTSCKVKVSPETHYTVTVIAYTVIGPGTPAISMTVTTPAAVAVAVKLRAPPVLAPPTISVKGQAVCVSWAQCRDSQPPVILYHLSVQQDDMRAHGREHADLDDAAIICYSGAGTSTELRDLVAGVNYRLRVCAENEIGKGPWSPVAMCFQKAVGDKKPQRSSAPPPAPPKIDLDKATRTSLRISWDTAASCMTSSAPGAKAARRSAALENDKETYNIELAEDSGEYLLVREGLAGNQCLLTKLKPGSRYLVRVTGHSHKRGASLWSRAAEGNFRTQAAGAGSKEIFLRYCAMLIFLCHLFSVVLNLQQ